MEFFDVVVIGGGPAGLIAAGKASLEGANVLLLEKMEKPARKLRITGKGRCNITNIKPLDDFLEEINPEPYFLRDAFKEFFSDEIIELLKGVGVDTVVERGQRVFPASNKAWDVAEGLVKWAKEKGAKILSHSKVDSIVPKGSNFNITYTSTLNNSAHTVDCASVILATGGKSYPATGSTGDGYDFAQQLSHTVTSLRPTLVGVETNPVYNESKGLTVKNVTLELAVNGKKVAEEFGEIEITDYGLSGAIVLRLSRKIVDALANGKGCTLFLDIKSALSPDQIKARIIREIEENGRMSVFDLLRKLVPKELAVQMIDSLDLAAQKIVTRLSTAEIDSIQLWLKEQKFEVVGHRSWNEAIATAGGISLKEINPRTMESRLASGLYFAGEVIDLDGSTGGYNLQIAYSTGWLAGKNAAENALANKKV
jgi:predicted Rossmann fold flavoprotein